MNGLFFILWGELMAINKQLYKGTFNKYKNLMFYDGHEVDYFYFSSLLTYMDDDPDYNALANEIAMQGASALAKPPLFRETNSHEMPALIQLQEALGFLQKAMQYERANEIQYFKQKFAILKDSFSAEEMKEIKEITQLEKLFADGGKDEFDYNYMLVLINILEQGLEQTKTIARYEEDRITTIAQQMAKIKQSRRKQLDGLWKKQNNLGKNDTINQNDPNYIKYIQNANKKFHRNIEVSYVTHGNLSSPLDDKKRKRIWGAKKYLANIPKTVDVKVGEWITSHIQEIFESEIHMKQFEELASEYLSTGKANTSTVREMLVKSIVNDGVKHTVEILEGAYKELPTDEFIKTLEEQIQETREYKISGYYSNFGQYGRHLNFFDTKTLKNGQEIADGLYDAYSNLIKELTKKGHKQTKEETQLMAAIKQRGHLQTYTRIVSLINKLESAQRKWDKWQQDISSGRRKQDKMTQINLGSDGYGGDVIVQVKITAKGVEFLGEYESQDSGQVLNNALNKTSLMRKVGNGRTKATTIKGAITGLKTKMSHSLRDDLSNAIANIMANSKNTKTYAQITTAFEKALTGLKLSVGGPKLSEIAPAILQATIKGTLDVHHPGSINRRNDMITITLQYNNIHLESTLTEIMNLRAEELVDRLDPTIANIQKNYITNFEHEFYQKMSKLKNTDANYNSLAENEKIWFEYYQEQQKRLKDIQELGTELDSEWGRYVENARKEGRSEEEINAQRITILESLKDSFFISNTMKTYNQYQNNLGFSGASLGANVEAQLTNLNTLFTKAGCPIQDSDLLWLRSAIINCSPVSIVGEKNKNIIENYLSSMAAFAMFDEGSAEAQIINDLDKKIEERVKTSPNILHLYRVNSLFVPGSVVLQRTIEELSKCLDISTRSLDIALSKRGAGVTIVNTMNEGLIPNRSTTSKRYPVQDTDPWGTVASATDSHVKLKIMFLAGLLDIINSMNKIMGNIQVP